MSKKDKLDIFDIDSDNFDDIEEEEQTEDNTGHNQSMTYVLLGIIALLLIVVAVLLFLFFAKNKKKVEENSVSVEDSLEEYSDSLIEKENESVVSDINVAPIVVPKEEVDTSETENAQTVIDNESNEDIEEDDKTAVRVDYDDTSSKYYSKEFILNELYPHLEANNLEAVWDLVHLRRYVSLSSSLLGTGNYYYQGQTDNQGRPDGVGLAIYEENTYYFGNWSHGVKSGEGRWYRYYINASDKITKNKVYMAHSYVGNWANDLPNGEGVENYDVNTSKLESGTRILRTVVGNFTNGLYDGYLYGYSIDYIDNVEEWEANCVGGVFTLWRDMSSKGECSVWAKKDDHENCMDIDKKDNKNCGIKELIK